MHTPVNGVATRKAPARTALSAWAPPYWSLLGRLAALVLLVSLLSTPATAEGPPAGPSEAPAGAPTEKQIEDQWLPAFAIASGITFQRQQASVQSRDVTNDTELRPYDDGRDWEISPYLGISLELASPVVRSIPGGPRFFVNAELLPTFGAALDLAKEGDPKGFLLPETEPVPPSMQCPFGINCFDQNSIAGVGSRTTAQVQPLVFASHAGVSIPFELYGRRLYVKPSFGWIRYTMKVDGRVLSALKPSLQPGDIQVPDIRFITLENEEKQSFDAIGPGLELELDVGRFGPLAPSLYIEGHGYRLLGDRTMKFSDSSGLLQCGPGSSFACPVVLPPAEYDARWSFKADPWIYRGGIGMRFRWIGY